jgi:hypothetical protein
MDRNNSSRLITAGSPSGLKSETLLSNSPTWRASNDHPSIEDQPRWITMFFDSRVQRSHPVDWSEKSNGKKHVLLGSSRR